MIGWLTGLAVAMMLSMAFTIIMQPSNPVSFIVGFCLGYVGSMIGGSFG